MPTRILQLVGSAHPTSDVKSLIITTRFPREAGFVFFLSDGISVNDGRCVPRQAGN